MSRLKFVTSNAGKAREVSEILGRDLEQVDLDVEEIQAVELEAVVKDKAERSVEVSEPPLIVEDTGLYFKGWNGFPGALIKWLQQRLGLEKICGALEGVDRSAIARTAVCLHNGDEFEIFRGDVEGRVPEEPRGDSDFGWDPIFIPEGRGKSFAEMTSEKKNEISMRKRAVSKLKEFLEDNPGFLS